MVQVSKGRYRTMFQAIPYKRKFRGIPKSMCSCAPKFEIFQCSKKFNKEFLAIFF